MDVRARRRRRLRALPWSWDSDTKSDIDAPSCDGAVCSNVPPELLNAMERDLTTEVPRRSVNNPGPPRLIRYRLASSSDAEPLVRPIIGRGRVPKNTDRIRFRSQQIRGIGRRRDRAGESWWKQGS